MFAYASERVQKTQAARSPSPTSRRESPAADVPGPAWSAPRLAATAPLRFALQRKCDSCATEEERPLQRKAAGPWEEHATHIEQPSGGGEPLQPALSARFERRLGHDLGSVRIHRSAAADASARGVNALAYTVGDDIVFRAGHYDPDSRAGQRLLAHELTHVVQQRGGQQRPGVSAPGDAAEIEADRMSDALVGGQSALPTPNAAPSAVARQDAGVTDDADAGAVPGAPEAESRNAQIACVARLGGHTSTRDAGLPSAEDLSRYNEECRRETRYTGPDVTVSDDAARQYLTGEILDPAKIAELRALLTDFNSMVVAGEATREEVEIVGGQLEAVGAAMRRVGVSPTILNPPAAEPEPAQEQQPMLAAGGATLAVGGLLTRVGAGAGLATGVALSEVIVPAVIITGIALALVALIMISTGSPHIDVAAGQTLITAVAVVAATVARVRVRRKRRDYLCTAQCQSNGAPGGAYYVSGESSQNCSIATLNAKAAIPPGEYPRHCSCSDTDGFRGTGHQCEAHIR